MGSARQTAVDWARAQIGKPYVFGATGPNSFDCSGLTQGAYKAAGISIPRIASAQYLAGTKTDTPQPGDLVFWWSEGTIGHVGLYIGGGRMIAAPQPGESVKEQAVYGTPAGYRTYPGMSGDVQASGATDAQSVGLLSGVSSAGKIVQFLTSTKGMTRIAMVAVGITLCVVGVSQLQKG